MKILITGAAGFIGFHLSKNLLEEDIIIHGIDNINEYYDSNLKERRLKKLKVFKNFSFERLDIAEFESMDQSFNKFKPNMVVNLAAQPGVRSSLINPTNYIDSNLVGFFNIIELCRHYNVEGLVYASSSSVYGGNKNLPYSVSDRSDNPLSLYAATKKANELIANSYSHLYGIHTTSLRYFTVYGPWGRPDMAYYIFTKKILNEEPINVFNNGNMKRDFTYIDDIIIGTKKAIKRNYKCEIFNLGNNKSEKLIDLIKIIEKETGKNAIINFKAMQLGDVKETCSNIDKSSKKLNFSPSISINEGLPNFVGWYKSFINLKL